MTKVVVAMSMSLDGIAGPETADADGMAIFTAILGWQFPLRSWRQEQGMDGGEDSVDSRVWADNFARFGPQVIGRTMFDFGQVSSIKHHSRPALSGVTQEEISATMSNLTVTVVNRDEGQPSHPETISALERFIGSASGGVWCAEQPGFRCRRSWWPGGQPRVKGVDQRAGILPGSGEGPAAGEQQPAA